MSSSTSVKKVVASKSSKSTKTLARAKPTRVIKMAPQRKNPGIPETKLKTLLSEYINADVNKVLKPIKDELLKYSRSLLYVKNGSKPELERYQVTKLVDGVAVPQFKTVRDTESKVKGATITRPDMASRTIQVPLTEEEVEEYKTFSSRFEKYSLKKFKHEKRAFSAKKIRFGKGALYVLASFLDFLTLEMYKSASDVRRKNAEKQTRGLVQLHHFFNSDYAEIPGISAFAGLRPFLDAMHDHFISLSKSQIDIIRKEYKKELREAGLIKRKPKTDKIEVEEQAEAVVEDDLVSVAETTNDEEKEISLGYYIKDWFKSYDSTPVSSGFTEFIESLIKSMIKKISLASYKISVSNGIQKIRTNDMVELLATLAFEDGVVSRKFTLRDINIPDEEMVKAEEAKKSKDPTYKYIKKDLPTEPSVEAVAEDSLEGAAFSVVADVFKRAEEEFEVIKNKETELRKAREAKAKAEKASEEDEEEVPVKKTKKVEVDEEATVVKTKKVGKK
jgi:hypothetical protein